MPKQDQEMRRFGRAMGRNLAQILRQRNVTRYRLARETGISYSLIWSIAHGNGGLTSAYTLARIAKALDVPLSTLINGGEECSVPTNKQP